MSQRFAFVRIRASEAVASVASFASARMRAIGVVTTRVLVAFVRAESALVDVNALAVLLLVSAETSALVGTYCIHAV